MHARMLALVNNSDGRTPKKNTSKFVRHCSLSLLRTACIYYRDFMAKYTYHHYHPQLQEKSDLHHSRHNDSKAFYANTRGARIVKVKSLQIDVR